ncbi:hypothetical protein ACIA8G_09370 [Lentzea sp. NPDC051213]|uniref:hypothetical protein n=1 Tax=Lentzea sp. NPDC051213 TaxID=3364126 RepID=UPI003791B797
MDFIPAQKTGTDDTVFAGDAFLELAASGALVLDPASADRLIEELRATLDLVRARITVNEMFATRPRFSLDGLSPEAADAVADAVFAGQVVPGRMEASLTELPKYIRALEMAKRTWLHPVE